MMTKVIMILHMMIHILIVTKGMAVKNNKINILVMPTDKCNMNCIYCFHNSHHEKLGAMSLETLNRMFNIVFKSYNNVTFIWHGGEPMTMGLDFYKKVIDMQSQYKNVIVENRMQSNLTLLTDEMADFFCKNNFGIGASFDGIMNEKLRGNTEKILSGRNKILVRGKNCGFIMVVSKKNIDTLIESYEFFKQINANYTINTYVSTPIKNNCDLELEANYTSKKLIEFFNFWIKDTSCKIHVNYFERIILHILYRKKSVCKYNSCLGKWMGIRYDGNVVPCNRYFPEQYSYGNVWKMAQISEAFESDGFKNLLTNAVARRKKCKTCKIFDFCTGGCNNVALNENGICNNEGISCIIINTVYCYLNEYIVNLIKSDYVNKTNPIVVQILKNSQNNSYDIHHHDIHYDSNM